MQGRHVDCGQARSGELEPKVVVDAVHVIEGYW
jgi:hypothetical protein